MSVFRAINTRRALHSEILTYIPPPPPNPYLLILMIIKIYGISTVCQSMGQIFDCAKVNKKIAYLSVLIITSENIP